LKGGVRQRGGGPSRPARSGPAGLLVIAALPPYWPACAGVNCEPPQWCGFHGGKEKEVHKAPGAGKEVDETPTQKGGLPGSSAPKRGRVPSRGVLSLASGGPGGERGCFPGS
jgi:hypothetical protein